MAGPNLPDVAFGWESSREPVEAIDRDVFRHLDRSEPRTGKWIFGTQIRYVLCSRYPDYAV